MTRRAAGLALGAVLLAAGCGGTDAPDGPVADTAPGRYSGSDGSGLGAAVDFVGFDSTKRRIEDALRRAGDTDRIVGIVSLVNRTTGLIRIPTFRAELADGRRVPLDRATRLVRRGRIVGLPDPGPYIPVEGALTVYVTLAGRPADIRRVTMDVGAGADVDLSAEPAPPR